MNNSSEISNYQVFGEYISEASAQILAQLNDFVREKYYLFDYYKRHKHIQKQPILQILFNSLRDLFWESWLQKILTFLIAMSFLVIFIIKSWNNNIDELFISISALIYLLSLSIKILIFLFSDFKTNIRKNNNHYKYIYAVASYNISNHLNYINNIGNNYNSKYIEIEEDRFKIAMIDQARSKEIADSFIPLFSTIYAIVIFFLFGNVTLKGVSIFSLIATVFSILIKISYKRSLINQHCLFILQKALAIAKKREKKASNNNC